MNKFELQPDYENLKLSLLNNSIGRNEELFYFVRFINEIGGNCSISLNARWGEGKTFFVKQAKLIFDAHNEYCNEYIQHGLENVADANKIREWVNQATNNYEIKPMVTVYYDAWENDEEEEPVLSLIASILDSRLVNYDSERVKNIYDKMLDIGGSIFKAKTGISVSNIEDSVKNSIEIACKQIRTQRELKGTIKDFFDSLLLEQESGIVVFIDELDRCKPTYAVKLLERIKHYFNSEKITFVFSINREQLQHTIKRHYGNDFDSDNYLSRFFDFNIDLLPCDKKRFYGLLGLKEGAYVFDQMIKEVSEYFAFSLRESTRFYNSCNISYRKLVNSSLNGSPSFNDFKSIVGITIPVLIGYKFKNYNDFCSIVEGSGKTIFGDICCSNTWIKSRIEYEFNRSMNLENKESANVIVDRLYDAIFGDALKENFSVNIGSIEIREEDKKILLQMISLISPYSVYRE